jgi:chromosome segregation ATPase
VRDQYEAKQGKGPDAKRVTELEGELEQTKLYYQKRIRELEDKYKYGGATSAKDKKDDKKDKKEKKEKKDDDKKDKKDKKDDEKKDKKAIIHNLEDKVQGLEEQIEKLTKERNILAQKVVNIET